MDRLDYVFAASRDLVIALDAQGEVTYRNRAANARNLAPETTERIVSAARKVGATGQADSLEWGEVGPAGVRAWYSTELAPMDGGGILVTSRDITAIRRREQLMVDTQGVAHLGTWEWDVSQPTATWSEELYRIYGLTPETYTPSYERYLTLVHPDDRQRVIDATNRVFHEHVPYSHDERIYRPDGSIRHLHTWAYPVLDDAGKLTHLIGVCQDITDRAVVEEFNSMVSHDLRAPLSVIQMCVDLLAPELADLKKARTYVERIRRAADNMTTLLRDLMTFAHFDKGTLHLADIDVSAMCAEQIAELTAATPDRQVTVAIADGLRCTADPRLFRFVLGNVVSNAWKYTSKEPQARIEIGSTEREGKRALFVRDNGIGFDPAEAPRLFAPFERLNNAVGFPGNGIGLAIVDKIVERHGGRVDSESSPGAGATFYIMMPAPTSGTSAP